MDSFSRSIISVYCNHADPSIPITKFIDNSTNNEMKSPQSPSKIPSPNYRWRQQRELLHIFRLCCQACLKQSSSILNCMMQSTFSDQGHGKHWLFFLTKNDALCYRLRGRRDQSIVAPWHWCMSACKTGTENTVFCDCHHLSLYISELNITSSS